ncbi:MAG: NAD(P)/FAD-dependent oxidoreductase [Acidobacteriota bacterium]
MSPAPLSASGRPLVVVGAGPAGLTAALELARIGVPVLVLEAGPRVGGLSQTVEHNGFRFDIGGHRFFSKVAAVTALWRSVLGPDFIRRPRLSRIFYNGSFFDYPLKPMNALKGLGPMRSVGILASYVFAQVRPIRPEVSFEDWVTNRFGKRLYRTFFKTYTEKVWGIPCTALSARWAAQRIMGLSLATAVLNMLAPKMNRRSGRTIKTLIDEFEYPRLGPGMMWEAFAREVERLGGEVRLNAKVTRILHDAGRVDAVEIESGGVRSIQPVSNVISTMPLRHLIRSLGDQAPSEVRDAAQRLKYRDFLTVALMVDQPDVFQDNWIYIHDPAVKVGRIQNFKNWSPEMVPDQSKTCLGLEYFCTAGDDIWSKSEQELIELATAELGTIGLVAPERVFGGTVVYAPKAYPVYDEAYEGALAVIKPYLGGFGNLLTIGRNGTHTYNNQDHSMVMGMLAVRKLLGEQHDLWNLDGKDEYLEEVQEGGEASLDLRELAGTQPIVPTPEFLTSYKTTASARPSHH